MNAPSSVRCRAAVAAWCAVLAFSLTALTSPSAHGATIRVPADQPTIQAGIDAASAGDTVLVAPGTYAGPGNRALSFGGTDLVLRSSGGPVVTVIDCQTQGRGFHFHGGETSASVVEGFTIQNGLASGTYGGAIWIEGGSTPTIRDCRLESNRANTGGAIYVTSGATVSNCAFEGNTADNYGGGLYGSLAILDVAGCTFSENMAGFGAGMYVHSRSIAVLSDCDFTENAALNLAGGIYGSSSDVTLERCSFVGNTGTIGGGVHLEDGTASADSSAFRMNMANFAGGGMYADQVDSLRVTRCVFEGNETLSADPTHPIGGGGFWAGSGPTIDLYMADCVFTANRAGGGPNYGTGGGLNGGGSEGVIERCAFIDNHADKGGGGASAGGRLRDCDFVGNTSGASGGGLSGGHELVNCRFTDNHASLGGGGCVPTGFGLAGGCTLVGCEFSGNSADYGGGGLFWGTWQPFSIETCRFSDNHAPEGGGLFIRSREPSSVTGCTFERNTGYHQGGAAAVLRAASGLPQPVFSGCTLVGNASPLGASGLELGIPVTIENTIVALGTEGEAVTCTDMGLAVLSCTDIFGNAGGDWTGCISDQLGINGNFSADPLFCDAGTGDYTLAETSPCAPEHSPAGCGLIGAFPVACVNPIGVAIEGAPPVAGRLRVTPNPMQGSGLIEWVNENAARVSVRLYDPLGRLVTSRSLGLVPEGRQELRWDGLLGDRWLPPGVYLLELGGPSGGMDRERVILVR